MTRDVRFKSYGAAVPRRKTPPVNRASYIVNLPRSGTVRGLTLIEVIVGVFVMTVVFLGLFGAFRLSVELVGSTKARLGAVSLLGERMEYLRSLPYSDVGTVGGIPAGIVPQTEVLSLNGIPYTVRTLVLYTDAPEDGTGASDKNGITADYKTAKVEVMWSGKGVSRNVSLASVITPPGLETLESGGTLEVRILNALAAPVPQAVARVINASTTPAIDVTVSTNNEGYASFPGAPEGSNYEVRVSKAGYSSTQTYPVTPENPSPSPGNVSVVDQTTSSVTFFIDLLGSLRFSTFEPVGAGGFLDSFDGEGMLSATSSTETVSGALVLTQNTPGVYASQGSAVSTPISPQYLASWNELTFQYTTPPETSGFVRLFYFDGSSYVPVPDEALPGNSAGLTGGARSLSGLAPQTYASLQLRTELASGTGAATPELLFWSVSYTAGPTPLPGVAFDIRGDKSIGFDGSGAPIYKYTSTFTTPESGVWLLENMEWDRYSLFLSNTNHDIVELCPRTIDLAPGTQKDVTVYAVSGTPNSLRVIVESAVAPISGAAADISGPMSSNKTTSACGQTYFGGLTSGTYTLTVTKAGFAPWTEQVAVAGDIAAVVLLSPL